jgi:Ca2+-binding RTX toxin-like protein
VKFFDPRRLPRTPDRRTAVLAGMLTAFSGLLVLLVVGAAPGATPQPACAAGVTTNAAGTEVFGTPCNDVIVVASSLVRIVTGGEGNDVIYANPYVEEVDGGPGDDVIYGELPETETGAPEELAPFPAAPTYEPEVTKPVEPTQPIATASAEEVKCTAGTNCYGGLGNQHLVGSTGNDTIFGERGDDEVEGNAGNDALYGGIGDDSKVVGGAGNDLVSGGPGADYVNGNADSDLARGDATTDEIKDTGTTGTDTLSFATAVTPGFHGSPPVAVEGFPADADSEERGVYVRLDGGEACTGLQACDNSARYAGGNDTVEGNASGAGFEDVIGSPFADVIVGSGEANVIDGGGGADILLGEGGNDTIYGGAEGDYIEGGTGTNTAAGQTGSDNCVNASSSSGCEGTAAKVTQRNRSLISAGLLAAPQLPSTSWSEPYLVGSTGNDKVTASYNSTTGHVSFTASAGAFNTVEEARTEGCTYSSTVVECTPASPPDVVAMDGMTGEDEVSIYGGGFPITTTPVLNGGEGSDLVKGGGNTEDVLVDGDGIGNDTLYAYNWDDELLNNEGEDHLYGGPGNDLLVSATTCEGDLLQGAEAGEGDSPAKNDASWAQLPSIGVTVDLQKQNAGNAYGAEGPFCGSGAVDTLRNISDVEGSSQRDMIYGDGNPNLLLGHAGQDELYGREGADTLNSLDAPGTPEADVDGGGPGSDNCIHDGLDTLNSCP